MPKTKPEVINAKEKQFALLWLQNGRNGTRAIMAVFPRIAEASARSKAPLWLARPQVQAYIKKITDEALEREHMGATETLAEMARIARSDISELTWKPGELDSAGNTTTPRTIKPLYEMPESVRRCIKKIKHGQFGVEIELWDKPSQLANIGRHHKLIGGDTNINITVGFSDRLRAAREKRLKGGR